jgi:hypothetical protein
MKHASKGRGGGGEGGEEVPVTHECLCNLPPVCLLVVVMVVVVVT